jgi:hypothetical protein
MSFLYRHALFVSRKQPYLDWANGLNDGVGLNEELSKAHRTVYLVPELDREPVLDELLDEFWEDIFYHELGAWMLEPESWPTSRTREMFSDWFDIELNDAVHDLTPEEPLTQHEVDQAELADVLGHCAGCGIEIDDGAGRFTAFTVADRSRLALYQGRVYPLAINDDEAVRCIVAVDDSDEARAGEDLLVRVCSSRCEREIRSIVPKALRRWSRRPTADA